MKKDKVEDEDEDEQESLPDTSNLGKCTHIDLENFLLL